MVHQLHPYHKQRMQAMGIKDFEPRVKFCHTEFPAVAIVHTDEACFTRDGVVNCRNSHVWNDEHPLTTRVSDHQHQFCYQLVGWTLSPATPFEWPALLAMCYQSCLRPYPSVSARVGMWLQLDNAPAHFDVDVHEHLDNRFTNCWIGRMRSCFIASAIARAQSTGFSLFDGT
ncbi:hypothetical protein PR048_004898 [Dryococelus australis]|uniref:Transposase n=1 Tax=Dryococelus australis TaxID=614101 RepID=A0ABQ9I6P8_9NEOP|nr:hypothetical protein PR048_004898 [Dryococelus australis]